MSISSLANAAAARRSDFAPVGTVPHTLSEIATASASVPSATPAASDAPTAVNPGGLPGAPAVPPPASLGAQPAAAFPSFEQKSTAVNTTLNLLFGYIPTEVLTLYVAVLASTQQKGMITWAGWAAFWSFLVATPVVVWLIYGAKIKAAQKAIPIHPRTWPVWEMFAATVAFCAWAFALPNAPFTGYIWYSSALAGVAVLVASTLLGLLAPLFQRPLSA